MLFAIYFTIYFNILNKENKLYFNVKGVFYMHISNFDSITLGKKKEKLRVSNSINFNFSETDHYNVKDIAEAVILINNLADAQLKNPKITDNMFSLEVYNNDNMCWENWEDGEGNSVDDYEIVGNISGVVKLIDQIYIV